MSLIKKGWADAQKTAMAGGNFAKKVVTAPYRAGVKVGTAARVGLGKSLDRMAKSGGSLGGPNAKVMQDNLNKKMSQQRARDAYNRSKNPNYDKQMAELGKKKR